REARARRVHARRRRRVQLPPGGGRRAVVGVAPLRLGCHRATRSGVSPPSPSAWSFTRWPAFFRAPLPRPRPHWSPHPEPPGLDRHPVARFLSSAPPPTPSPLLASPPDPLSLRERGHSRPAPLGSPAATSCSCARDSGSASGSSWPEYRSDGSPPAHHGGPQGRARARVAPGADTRRAVRVVAVAEPRGAGPQVPPPACAARLHRGLLLRRTATRGRTGGRLAHGARPTRIRRRPHGFPPGRGLPRDQPQEPRRHARATGGGVAASAGRGP